jgi:hypothetical protein
MPYDKRKWKFPLFNYKTKRESIIFYAAIILASVLMINEEMIAPLIQSSVELFTLVIKIAFQLLGQFS